MIKTVVFDFDGVLVDSEPLKTAGFRRIFSDFNEPVPEEIIATAMEKFSAGRGNRFDIIRETLRVSRGAEPTEEEVKTYVARYGAGVDEAIRSLSVSPESHDALGALAARFPLYVNSNTPEQPVQETVQRLGLGGYFKKVLGTPNTKVENLKAIAALESATPEEMVFVGDGEADYNAAVQFGCRFIPFGAFPVLPPPAPQAAAAVSLSALLDLI